MAIQLGLLFTSKKTNGTVLFDAGVVFGNGLHVFFHDRSEFGHVSDNVILDEVFDLFVRTRHGDGVSLRRSEKRINKSEKTRRRRSK